VYEKKNEEESSRPRKKQIHTQHPSIRTSKRFFCMTTQKYISQKKNVHIQEGYK